MFRVIGIDPSLTATGVCDARGELFTVGGPAKHGDTRLAFIHAEIERVAKRQEPDLAVIEGPYVAHQNNAMPLGMVHGVVRLALVRERVPFVIVPPATLKKYATGDGHADKRDMRHALRARGGPDIPDDNQCDAWWLRHMGLDRLGGALVRAAHRASLDVPAWPAVAAEDEGEAAS